MTKQLQKTQYHQKVAKLREKKIAYASKFGHHLAL